MKISVSFFNVALIFVAFTLVNSTLTVSSYQSLGKSHCQQFQIQLLWRVAAGRLSQKYGQQYFDYDCYVRQFVGEDKLKAPVEDEQDEEDSESEKNQELFQKLKQDDLVVKQYSKGIRSCLKTNNNQQAVKSVYQIWRFFRYLVQHDYAYEWMRAKIRSGLGYESERPNSWMDGDNSAPRLRLDKLFSNQFYQYVDTLMFKDFLYPLMTFLKSNTVVALSGKITSSGLPIIAQSLQTKNFWSKIFLPVIFQKNGKSIFTYTVPGIPLLLAGSSRELGWAFTGVLVDRSNIQEIETVGNKFYNHETEQWLKLSETQIKIDGVTNRTCKFMSSEYGSLFTKQDRDGKTTQYIVRWHEDTNRIRHFFQYFDEFIQKNGLLPEYSLQFPFNSLVTVNNTGIYQYICQQAYPSYFLYPEMFGEPENIQQRWFSYPNKKYLVVSNQRLTPTKQQYSKSEALSAFDEELSKWIRHSKQSKWTPESILQLITRIKSTHLHERIRQMLMRMYRKIKFYYLPDEENRKKADQIVNLLDKSSQEKNQDRSAAIFTLWDYFLRDYTFNYVSSSEYGKDIVKHHLLTDHYWVNQIILWEKGTSYGECDSDAYEVMKKQVNGTGHNSSCYLNIVRAINMTRKILQDKYGDNYNKVNINDFVEKKYFQSDETNFLSDKIEEVFGNYYSKNILFSAGIGNSKIIYHEGYKEERKTVNLNQNTNSSAEKGQEEL